jgi:competence protein ComFC
LAWKCSFSIVFDMRPVRSSQFGLASLATRVRQYIEAGLAFLYPECCQLCQKARATRAEGFVCGNCKTTIKLIRPPFCERCGRPFEGAITNRFECENCRDLNLAFTSARSAALAREPLLDIIHRYKYQRALWFEPVLGELLVEHAKPELAAATWDYLVPIPLHSTREREREFNQAERLASYLGRTTGIPVHHRLLRRTVQTQSQTVLSRDQRIVNVKNAFAMNRPEKLDGGRFVLIDDVFTTGATAGACARVLRLAGAAEVCVWTVARGL